MRTKLLEHCHTQSEHLRISADARRKWVKTAQGLLQGYNHTQHAYCDEQQASRPVKIGAEPT
jgi:hypothetical protein